ncbi:C40 family peptidase [Solimonas fluminis]|uniref:C40 family peptidase n=1 Tax=Solimonas fluminis TaxID=2086571 RepID=UPI0010574F0D|nr:C40 family peptidase [Solimonas fluminis]
MNGADVVLAARRWVGTPYLHQARLQGVGVDCIGLVLGVGAEVGAWPASFNYTGYGRLPHNNNLLQEAQRHFLQIPIEDVQPGCILMMRWFTEPRHVAVFAGETLIHAANNFRRVVEHRYDEKSRKRTLYAFRFPGVSYV